MKTRRTYEERVRARKLYASTRTRRTTNMDCKIAYVDGLSDAYIDHLRSEGYTCLRRNS